MSGFFQCVSGKSTHKKTGLLFYNVTFTLKSFQSPTFQKCRKQYPLLAFSQFFLLSFPFSLFFFPFHIFFTIRSIYVTVTVKEGIYACLSDLTPSLSLVVGRLLNKGSLTTIFCGFQKKIYVSSFLYSSTT